MRRPTLRSSAAQTIQVRQTKATPGTATCHDRKHDVPGGPNEDPVGDSGGAAGDRWNPGLPAARGGEGRFGAAAAVRVVSATGGEGQEETQLRRCERRQDLAEVHSLKRGGRLGHEFRNYARTGI